MKVSSLRRALAAALFVASALPPLSASAIGRLANVSVYDRTERRTLPVHWHNGQAWVVGSPGNEYQVNVRNPAGTDVLTVVSVDGVNVITGETAAPAQTGYIVDPWRALDIKGWRKDTTRTAAFYFTSLADSYAARTGRPDNVGVIGVAVFRRKMEPVAVAPVPKIVESRPLSGQPSRANELPVVESVPAPAAPSASARDSAVADSATRKEKSERSRLGTGHGRSEYSQVTMVDFERATREPEEVLTIRYDSYANLVARGVIVARAPERWPNPFPHSPQGFVPDPPRW
ncbi:MAG: hypothetical protein JNM76_04680 [Betaproteobacteria bacterium]|nr:hypothetical protein [Betaproteobacteria bacterium]